MEVVIDRTLSFPEGTFASGEPPFLRRVCLHSEKKGKYYVQSPKIDLLRKLLESRGHSLKVTGDGWRSYDDLRKVTISLDDDGKKYKFLVKFAKYPSYPLFSTEKYWQWANLSRRVSKKRERPLYEIKHPFKMVEAIEWLEIEGYDIEVKQQVREFIAVPSKDFAVIRSMNRSPDLVLKTHQEKNVDRIKEIGYRAIVGDDAGLGKTITAGEVIWNLFNDKKVKRVLWVVPTSALVYQVHDEMKTRYGTDTAMITGDRYSRSERLGSKRYKKIEKSIYEKNGFVITTWATFVKDWTGKDFYELTRKTWFDLAVFDEAHRAGNMKNKSFDAVLNCVAPYRIMLSGTVMPNGNWKELHGLVTATSPSSCFLQYWLSSKEEKYTDELAARGAENPEHEARLKVTKIALALLMRKVTRHRKDDVPGFFPRLVEGKVHVITNKDENDVIEIMFGMLSDAITEWKRHYRWKDSDNERERNQYKMRETVKTVLWQDLRSFCSHGSFSIKRRIEEILSGIAPFHRLIQERYGTELESINVLMDKGKVRMQPKNSRVRAIINQVKAGRVLVFNGSVRGSIELSKYLKSTGHDVKLVVGSTDQITEEDMDELEMESKKIGDDELNDIMEWFWFPWITIAKLSTLHDHMKVIYTGDSGLKRDSLYYVDVPLLGSKIDIDITWNDVDALSMQSARDAINLLSASKRLSVSHDNLAMLARPAGAFKVSIKINDNIPDRRVLVTTDKLNEGMNIQIADLVIFYDQPMSIKQREQRIARSRRMQSMHDKVTVISILCGLDYAILHTLERKYEAASRLGYVDPKPVSMKNVMEIMKTDKKSKKKEKKSVKTKINSGKERNKSVDLIDFLEQPSLKNREGGT
jgi:superfamily II DNA or RNA helicase